MEIDHVFVFVEPNGADLQYLNSLGLVETYRRAHRGQGTGNICYCFDNMFLECLWVTDVSELRSHRVARTGLYERSQWRTAGTSPFGIAWRTTADDETFRPETWAFRPPYLPVGMAIDVSVESDDPRQPMMFKSPGATPPAQWAPERRGSLQRPAGLGHVLALTLELPSNVAPSPTLKALAHSTCLDVISVPSKTPSIDWTIQRLDSDEPLWIRLPAKA